MIFNFILIITSTQKRLHNNNICCIKDDFERHKKLMFENYLGLYISFFKPQVGKITHSTNRGRSIREYKKLNSTKKFSIFFFFSNLVIVVAVNHYSLPYCLQASYVVLYTFVSHCLAFFYTNYPKVDTFFML